MSVVQLSHTAANRHAKVSAKSSPRGSLRSKSLVPIDCNSAANPRQSCQESSVNWQPIFPSLLARGISHLASSAEHTFLAARSRLKRYQELFSLAPQSCAAPETSNPVSLLLGNDTHYPKLTNLMSNLSAWSIANGVFYSASGQRWESSDSAFISLSNRRGCTQQNRGAKTHSRGGLPSHRDR
jgi:hypothetical protein